MKEIIRPIIEIIFIFIFLVCSLFYCTYLAKVETQSQDMLYEYNQNLKLAIASEGDNNKLLFPMTDNYAINNLDATIINVNNLTNTEVNYCLLLKVRKDSDLDYHILKIKVDNEIKYLKNLYVYEDEDYFYFDIKDSNIIDANNTSFMMWISDEASNYNGGSINYSFTVQNI